VKTLLSFALSRQQPAHQRNSEVGPLPRLDVRALQVFVLAAEGRTLLEVSQMLHLGSSHVTRLLQGLEATLGATLLIRTGGHSELTDAGRAALPHAKGLLQKVHHLADSVHR